MLSLDNILLGVAFICLFFFFFKKKEEMIFAFKVVFTMLSI